MRSMAILLLLAVPEVVAAASAEKLGWFQPAKNEVKGNLPNEQPVLKKTGDAVLADSWVTTGKKSGAGIPLAWNGKLHGKVTVGAESQFQLRKPGLTAAGEDKLDFQIDWGKFLFLLIPRSLDDPARKELGVGSHEVRLTIPDRRTRDPKKEKEIWLRGTEVRVFVDQKTGATSVYVTEGLAIVRAAGREVTVTASHSTHVPPDGPPTPPALEIVTDPFLNLRDRRLGLDLPR